MLAVWFLTSEFLYLHGKVGFAIGCRDIVKFADLLDGLQEQCRSAAFGTGIDHEHAPGGNCQGAFRSGLTTNLGEALRFCQSRERSQGTSTSSLSCCRELPQRSPRSQRRHLIPVCVCSVFSVPSVATSLWLRACRAGGNAGVNAMRIVHHRDGLPPIA